MEALQSAAYCVCAVHWVVSGWRWELRELIRLGRSISYKFPRRCCGKEFYDEYVVEQIVDWVAPVLTRKLSKNPFIIIIIIIGTNSSVVRRVPLCDRQV